MKNKIVSAVCVLVFCLICRNVVAAEELNSSAGMSQIEAEKQSLEIQKEKKELERQKQVFEKEKLDFERQKLNANISTTNLGDNKPDVDDEPKAGVNKHDGFFLRLAGGIGSLSTSEEVQGTKIATSGESGLFNFAIGGAIAENLILHLDLNGISSSKPKIKINGAEKNLGDVTTSASILGVGLTYYFPANIYVTGSLGVAQLTNKINGTEYGTRKGFGTNIMLGKEWWVSDNWGLGLAGQFIYASCPDESINGVTPYVHAQSFGVLFSATYN